jgi:cephalosporin hydroxylase
MNWIIFLLLFVVIDGAHDYKYVKADIEAWLPKVKSGGYLCGHDYLSGEHEEVIRAVNEAFGDNKKIYNVTWVHKVG